MKAFHINVVLMTLVVSLPACSIRKSEPVTGKVVGENVRNGEALFMRYCQKCHPQGEGGLGPALNTLNVPKFVKRFQVRHGLGVMPYFKKDQISKKDLHDITAYMGALKKLKKD